ncbi:hypothetical protein ACQ4PT_052466 [Festuca glaucescens]
MLSGFSALESLELKKNFGFARLWISSQTIKSIGFCNGWREESVLLQDLVIEDTPCLERFIQFHPTHVLATIRVMSAPKLKILGMLSKDVSELHFGTTVFQFMFAVSLTTKMRTMRVFVLESAGPNLDAVLNFLKCFPCLEKLYVIFQSGLVINNVRKYDPLDPIGCLELHLKEMVLKNYDGTIRSSIDFAKFFVLNAKVLKEIKITLPYHRQQKWFAKQHRLLKIENRASRDALIELNCGTNDNFSHSWFIHDLSMVDPFDMPSRPCSKCCCGPF